MLHPYAWKQRAKAPKIVKAVRTTKPKAGFCAKMLPNRNLWDAELLNRDADREPCAPEMNG